jgi:hypothetical protein
LYDPDALTKAYIDVKENNMAVKGAARLHSVPETTLRQRVIGAVSIDTGKSGPSPLFSCEQEARLVDHVTLMAKVGYGYTRPELYNLATRVCSRPWVKRKRSTIITSVVQEFYN